MNIITFQSETTIRWECMLGDFIMWVSPGGFLDADKVSVSISDMWQLRNNDFVTITNKTEDLPSWFELHPTETSGRLALWMGRKLRAGYEPKDIMDALNLWRVSAGERLVWVGQPRPWLSGENGVLGIIDFYNNALVVGGSVKSEETPFFGTVNFDGLSSEDSILCQSGLKAVGKLGPSRVMSEGSWTLGI